jgi:hypothetical protein
MPPRNPNGDDDEEEEDEEEEEKTTSRQSSGNPKLTNSSQERGVNVSRERCDLIHRRAGIREPLVRAMHASMRE